MCGRFAQELTSIDFFQFFNLQNSFELVDKFNITPQAVIPIILNSRKTQLREAHALRWGLIPSWSKEESIGHKLINARSETLFEKPSFKESAFQRRCIIPASGFYEWHTQNRTPYYITSPDHAPLAFAGIWDRWRNPQGQIVTSFAIITRDADAKISSIHHREPVMLEQNYYSDWLNFQTSQCDLQQILQTTKQEIDFWEVSPYVNDPKNNDEKCYEEAEMKRVTQLI